MDTYNRSDELSEAADAAEENGRHEVADDLRLLASYGKRPQEGEEDTPSYSGSGESAGIIASEVEELDIEWVWQNWIPKQFCTFLYGEAGLGKSSFLHYLTACVTRGWDLPDGSKLTEPRGVVYISYEEPTNSVLVPALRKSGADMSRVSILSKVKRDVQQLGDLADRGPGSAYRRCCVDCWSLEQRQFKGPASASWRLQGLYRYRTQHPGHDALRLKPH